MLAIYTDGSFRDETIAWAFVVVEKDEVIHTANGVIKTPKPDLLKTRNIAGEMKAVLQAVHWALDEGYSQVRIHADYVGVIYWVTGKWKARNYFTQKYRKWMRNANIDITFQHVKGHSGDTYNELADQLAKEAINHG